MAKHIPTEGGLRRTKSAERRAEILEHTITLFAEQGTDASLRAIGGAIGVSHAALRYYFASRDELLVEVYRSHENERREQPAPRHASAVASMTRSAERNASIPGLVELYATLTTDALHAARHPVTHEFILNRFRRVRSELSEKVRESQLSGDLPADLDSEDVAALVTAASDGLQLQWLVDPEAVDPRRSLALLDHLLQPNEGPVL
ncbi:TetR/AcrR family transcriptional regulator [Subtercola vilae]|uniref:TetR/AcrR family transcriptional regulator n=1 Tax=Subtercola vilae TaxID=2056433 RepID=A0A4V4REE9_9MICO|nr:TetR/AcrR family transcriptional regulator [Subtercola vilae]TIH33904.1 TetR/AcrR family transcriptional regulator [Subtercola vilae]